MAVRLVFPLKDEYKNKCDKHSWTSDYEETFGCERKCVLKYVTVMDIYVFEIVVSWWWNEMDVYCLKLWYLVGV